MLLVRFDYVHVCDVVFVFIRHRLDPIQQRRLLQQLQIIWVVYEWVALAKGCVIR